MAGTTQRPRRPGWVRRTWLRVAHFHGRRLGQTIPSLDEIDESIDKRVAAGESEDDVVTDVIEDFERSGATVSARTTPLVPASGIVVAAATFLAKDSEVDSAVVAAFAIGMALLGLGFLAMSVFTHAGRPRVGLPPTRGDIAFAHARLTKKESSAEVGSFLSARWVPRSHHQHLVTRSLFESGPPGGHPWSLSSSLRKIRSSDSASPRTPTRICC